MTRTTLNAIDDSCYSCYFTYHEVAISVQYTSASSCVKTTTATERDLKANHKELYSGKYAKNNTADFSSRQQFCCKVRRRLSCLIKSILSKSISWGTGGLERYQTATKRRLCLNFQMFPMTLIIRYNIT